MSRIVLIRLQPPIDTGRASLYYLTDHEEKIGTGPTDQVVTLKDYVGGKLEEQIEKGNEKFIVDLIFVKWVSSSDVGTILSWYRVAARHNSRLVLANPSQSIKEVMKITKLDTVIKVFETIEEAFESLSRS